MYDKILKELRSKSVVFTAKEVTDAIDVAYCVAVAKEKSKGKLKKLHITVDSSIFKNGLNVAIANSNERGLNVAAALGYVRGNTVDKVNVISKFSTDDLSKAKELVSDGVIDIQVKSDCDKLYIQTILENEENVVRTVIEGFHLNLVDCEVSDIKENLSEFRNKFNTDYIMNYGFGIEEFLDFVEKVDISELDFIEKGLDYNVKLAEYCNSISNKKSFSDIYSKYNMQSNMISRAQDLCMSAYNARSSGYRKSVMTMAGSANCGIITYLSNYAVAESFNIDKEKLIRAIALSTLTNIYIHSYIGDISVICGCGLSAGVGACVGAVYMLGGNITDIENAIKNVVSSFTGILCDGNKNNCALKIGLSADWAIKCALMALEGNVVDTKGILSDDLDEIFSNICYIYNSSSDTTNKSILDITMEKKNEQ